MRSGSSRSRSGSPRTSSTRSRSSSTVSSPSRTSGGVSRTASRPRSSWRRIASIAVTTHEGHEELQTFSQKLACTFCGLSFDELAPRNFSFNSPYGACPTCDGLGTRLEVDADLAVPDPTLSINEGRWLRGRATRSSTGTGSSRRSARPTASRSTHRGRSCPGGRATSCCSDPTRRSTSATRTAWPAALVLHELRGRAPQHRTATQGDRLRRLAREARTIHARNPAGVQGCTARPETLAVTVDGLHISALTDLSIRKTLSFLESMELSEREATIAERLLKGDPLPPRLPRGRGSRLSDALPAGRHACGERRSGSGRDPDRLGPGRRAVHPDEPSIGLHQRDNRRLLDT